MEKAALQAKPQVRLSAPDYVIEQIKQALAEGRLKPGDRLPAEPELEVLYGVSRGSIRQAMKSLEMLGVVTIRPGDGTYVNDEISRASFNPLIFALLLSRPSAHMISEARYAMERDILELILNDEERTRTVLTFPVETMALLAENGDIKDKEYGDFTAEMYAKGHSFFTYVSDNADSLSSCCRLRNEITDNGFS